MTPSLDDPAVLEAKRRRAARALQSIASPQEVGVEALLCKPWTYWLLMALLPAMLFLPGLFLSGIALGSLGLLIWLGVIGYGGIVWVAFCSVRIVLTCRRLTAGKRFLGGIGIWVALIAANPLVIYAVSWAFQFLVVFVQKNVRF